MKLIKDNSDSINSEDGQKSSLTQEVEKKIDSSIQKSKRKRVRNKDVTL